MLAQIMPPEGTVFSFKEGSSKMDHCALEELSYSLQACEPFSVSNIDPSISSIVKENSSSEILVGAFNSVTMVETSEQRDDKGNYEVNDTVEAKLNDRVCVSSPRRGPRVTKLDKKNSKSKAARKCSKKVFTCAMLDSILLRVARKKRTYNCRPARSSVWGSVGISQLIKNRASVVLKKGSGKSKKRADGQRSRMEKKIQTVRGLQISNEKTGASSGRIRIKVKLRKEMDQTSLADMVSITEDGLQNDVAIVKEIHKVTNLRGHVSNQEVHGNVGTKCCSRDLEKVVMLSEPIDSCLASKDLQNSVKCEKSDEFIADNHHQLTASVDIEGSGVVVDRKYLDLGTSPDSEVINLVPETQVYEKEQEDFRDVQISSPKFAVPSDIRSLNLPQGRSKKGNQSDNMLDSCDSNVPDELGSPEIINQASVVVKCGQRDRLGDGFEFSEASISTATANSSRNTSGSDGFSKKLLSSPRAGDLEGVFPRAKNKGRKSLKNSRSKQVSESGPKNFDLSRSRKGNACIQKGSSAKSVGRMKVKDSATCNELRIGHNSLDDFGKAKGGDGNMIQEVFNLDSTDGDAGNQCLPPKDAWVCCDECFKWRRIPHTLAGPVTNCRWTCKENFDKDFADCSIPQEKSNSEINTELGISDASCEEDADYGRNPSAVPQKTSWRRIKSNIFMHRSRKSQSIDEIMVCHCKPSTNGRLGCGNGCLNRMLNIECVKGACPCGESCSNQQFQKRQYAKLRKVWCGKKGYGLQLLEDISEGQFLIEYVGEVLDMQAYEARQRDYALKSHRHFYFMTLNGSEVIDACGKGNLGRFINHSCDPNCRTEKWIVNGEVCIGLFALKDLKKGEEVTFDYNYVRVFGAAAKKCACGSSQCRGYIGGDPQNSEVIVRGDSDDEFPESVMVYDDGESDVSLKNLTSATSPSDGTKLSITNVDPVMTNKDVLGRAEIVVDHLEGTTELQIADVLAKDGDRTDESANGVDDLEIIPGNSCIKSTLSEQLQTGEVEKSVEMLQPSIEKVKTSSQLDNVSVDTISDSQQAILSSPEASVLTVAGKKSLLNASYAKKKVKSDRNEDSRALKSSAPMRTSCLSYAVKKGRSNGNKSSNYGNVKAPETMVNKSHGLPNKPKKTIEGSRNCHFDAVEEKLNELLDIDGGISKRKDAAKGYLKLLLLTAASGDGGSGEAIQSNRDLSMILGAILKTKSRSVLVDIISKNGLQMLHNIMKRYRRDFSKIPILRKLLKVLEFLAATEIITLELINRDPPCLGVESFRESILTLTEHDDKQVHQIARNFRDKWIPWSLRKSTDFHRGSNCNRFSATHVSWWEKNPQSKDAVNVNSQLVAASATVLADAVMNEGCSSSSNGVCPTSGTHTRKRRSRWDEPGDPIKTPKIQPVFLQIPCSSSQPESRQHSETRADDGSEDMNEDVPPGFAPRNAPSFNQGNGSPFKVELGHPQGKFMNRMAVSYGIPMPVVQQLGCPKAEGLEEWVIAPGVPFQPFPPLPPYSRNRSNNVKFHQGNHHPATCRSDNDPASNSGSVPPDGKIQCANIRQAFQAPRDSHRLGRKYFRQQKWNNNPRSPQPWIKKQKLLEFKEEMI